MRFDSLLIGFIVLSLFVVGGAMILNDLNNSYSDQNINLSDDDFGDVYNTIDEMYDVAENSKDDALGGDITEEESWSSMTKGSYSAIRLITGSFKLFTDITNAIASKLGIPQFITQAAFIAFSITIVFGLIYMIFRYNQ